jgi:hypothetical protein
MITAARGNNVVFRSHIVIKGFSKTIKQTEQNPITQKFKKYETSNISWASSIDSFIKKSPKLARIPEKI